VPELGVNVVESRPEKRKDIESPIKPASELLPAAESVSAARLDPFMEFVNEVVMSFIGECISESVWVDNDADNGDGLTMDLLCRLVQDSQVIP
jgi:hypothetical protein